MFKVTNGRIQRVIKDEKLAPIILSKEQLLQRHQINHPEATNESVYDEMRRLNQAGVLEFTLKGDQYTIKFTKKHLK